MTHSVRNESYSPLTSDPYELQRLLGYQVTEWSDGHARVEMPIRPNIKNRHGIPHGGIYALLLDTAAGFSGSWRPPPQPSARAMTLSLAVNFVGLPAGNLMIAVGTRTGGGRRTFFSSCTLTDELGTLVATGQAALRYRGTEDGSDG